MIDAYSRFITLRDPDKTQPHDLPLLAHRER
jgi:hypothetical protein